MRLRRSREEAPTTDSPAIHAAPTRVGRAFYFLAIATALSVGALQMYRVRGGFLTDYGADIFGTAWLYALVRLGRTIFQRGRAQSAGASAAVVLILCVSSEFGQRLHWVPGHYDPYDLVAYAVTLAGCWALDRRAPFVETADKEARRPTGSSS